MKNSPFYKQADRKMTPQYSRLSNDHKTPVGGSLKEAMCPQMDPRAVFEFFEKYRDVVSCLNRIG